MRVLAATVSRAFFARFLRVALLALAATSACTQPDAEICASGRLCPAGSVCNVAGDECVPESLRSACEGIPDNARCELAGGSGLCESGLCTPDRRDACHRDPWVDDRGSDYTFVVDRLLQRSREDLGLDLDCDGLGDDALSLTLRQAWGNSPTSQPNLDRFVRAGQILTLVAVRAASVSDADGIGLWFLPGTAPSVPPCRDDNDILCGQHLDGTASFDVATDDSPRGFVAGESTSSRFSSVSGAAVVQLALVASEEPFSVQLHGARVSMTLEETGLANGVLGGGVARDDFEGLILPAIYADLQSFIPEVCRLDDEDGLCACSSIAISIYLKDEPGVCELVPLAEFVAGEAARLDLDLYDCPTPDAPLSECVYDPRSDGILDSISFSVGFTAVPAQFDLPLDLPTTR